LIEDCTPFVRDLVLGAVEAGGTGTGPRRKRFEFNRFEVTVDLNEGMAVIEDVLDPTGSQRLALADFTAALRVRR